MKKADTTVIKKSLFSWVLERDRGWQASLFAMVVATVFFRVFPLEMQKRIVDLAIPFKDLNLLLTYCGLYIGAVVLAGGLKYAINVLQGYLGQRISYEMRARIYEHILSLPLSFFRRTPPGMVIASLTSELGSVGELLGGALAVPIINVLSLLTFAGYMAYLNPLLAALSFAMYPIEIILIPILQKRFNRLNQKRIDVTRSMSNVIGEAVSGIHEIHGNASYGLENLTLCRFAQTLFALRHQMNIFRYLIKFTNNFFQSLGPFTLFLVGGYLTIHGRLDLGSLVAFLSAYEKLYDPWKELMEYYQDFQDGRVRYRRITEYFDVKPDFALAPPEGRKTYDLEGRIDAKDVSFVVDGQVRILDQVSFELQPGEQLALVGLSGSGKSTLAMVIGQLYSYTGGHVLIDGKELKALSKLDVSKNIGYVAQSPFIFDGPVRDNLLYSCQSLALTLEEGGQPLPDLEGVLKVLEDVGLSDDVLAFGLNARLRRGQRREIEQKLIDMRKSFFDRWGAELADAVDFFDVDRFQYYTTLGENIIFGYPNREDLEPEQLAGNALFRSFLLEADLAGALLEFAKEVAATTVSLLRDLKEDPFFFEKSPIPLEEFERYQEIVDRMSSAGARAPSKRDESALLELALRFVPAQHKMVALPSHIEARILLARRRFMEKIGTIDPGAFTFYRPTEYLYTHSIMENVLFGHPRTDRPTAMETIRQKVVELLIEEGLLEEVMDVGLEFQVGSKGDRLSGGQKQKLALARVLLKAPQVLILDEATASLDNASQARIEHLLNSERRGRQTLIAVVHRLEMVRGYDHIAVMKAGQIVEAGSYEELMTRKGAFYELAHGSP